MHPGVGPTPELTCLPSLPARGPLPLSVSLLAALLIVKGIDRFPLQLSSSIRLPRVVLADRSLFDAAVVSTEFIFLDYSRSKQFFYGDKSSQDGYGMSKQTAVATR